MIAALCWMVLGGNIGFLAGACWASRSGRPDRLTQDNRKAVAGRMLRVVR